MVAGRKPKEPEARVNRMPPTHEWVEVPHVPYKGKRPRMPYSNAMTRAWWDAVSKMPHCALWEPADWQFALDTAAIHAQFAEGDMKVAGELRIREKVMGTTLDARRDLRIRYIDPNGEEKQEEPPTIDEGRRARLLSVVV